MVLAVMRWWFGVTYAASAVGLTIAAPVWMASGNWGGLYLLGGALVIFAAAWAIHPWGMQRSRIRKVPRPTN
jgi:hypothetical protein